MIYKELAFVQEDQMPTLWKAQAIHGHAMEIMMPQVSSLFDDEPVKSWVLCQA